MESDESVDGKSTVDASLTEGLDDRGIIAAKLLSGEYRISEKRGRSKVWSVFGPLVDADGNNHYPKYVGCKTCKKVLMYNTKSTSNLVKHKCYVIVSRCIENESKIPVDNDIKKDITRSITKWIICNCRPFNIVKDEGLVDVLQHFVIIGARFGIGADLEKALPQPSTISNNVEKLYEDCFEKVKAEINSVRDIGFSFTADIWTDNFLKQSYLAVTMHYLQDGCLKVRLLGLKSMQNEMYTGETIYATVEKLLNYFGCAINFRSTIVTKMGWNMEHAFQSSQHIFCINHLLNDVVQSGMQECSEVSKTCFSCIDLVKYFKKSEPSNTLTTSLKPFCATRWNSMFYLLNSIVQNWSEIIQVLKTKSQLHRVDSIKLNNLKDLLSILQPFADASKMLEGANNATLHLVLIYIHRLKKTCSSNSSDSHLIMELKTQFLHYLDTLVMPRITLFHKIAVFLFPPTNKLLQFSEDEKKDIEEECRRLMLQFESEMTATKKEPSNSSPTFSQKDLFLDFVQHDNPTDNITQELQLYKTTKIDISENFDVFSWWQLHKNNLPLLYKLSCLILTTPASSTSSERVFSLARNMLSEKNSSAELYDKAVKKMVFIYFNFQNEELECFEY